MIHLVEKEEIEQIKEEIVLEKANEVKQAEREELEKLHNFFRDSEENEAIFERLKAINRGE